MKINMIILLIFYNLIFTLLINDDKQLESVI